MSSFIIVAGIDPGATSGLVALAVDPNAPNDSERWRWVGSAVISKASSTKRTRVMNTLALYHRAHELLKEWRARHVAIERPADMGGWVGVRGGQGQRGQSTGTAFAIGECYGMLAVAAHTAGCKVHDYPVTSRKANPSRNKPERVGWMPTVRGGRTGNLTHVMPREELLAQLHLATLPLRERPHNGVLARDRATVLDENVRMAFGVLRFHLSRQYSLSRHDS
jgi:Holliday junction resolvasome RuvABC endonuclease subunit